MTAFDFIDECKKIYEKDLKNEIASVYLAKLNRYTSPQLVEILNAVLEEVPRFPRISNIIAAGNKLGYAQREATRTHTWTPTECRRCAGSGRMAAFWRREFEFRESGKVEVLTLAHVCPYHESGERNRRGDDFEIRSIFRCDCEAGTARTLETGLPRWSGERALKIERMWA